MQGAKCFDPRICSKLQEGKERIGDGEAPKYSKVDGLG